MKTKKELTGRLRSPGLRPGEGFRLLKKGESIEPTDDVWSDGVGPWEPAGNPLGLPSPFRVKFDPEIMNPFRRRIKTRSVGGAKRSRQSSRNSNVTSPKAPQKRKSP